MDISCFYCSLLFLGFSLCIYPLVTCFFSEFIWLELYPAVRNLPQLASALFNATFSILKSLPPFEQLRTNCSQPLHEINSKQAFIQLPPDMSKELIDWCLHEDDALEANIDDMNSTCSYNLIDRKVRTEICLLRLHPSCLDLNYVSQSLEILP